MARVHGINVKGKVLTNEYMRAWSAIESIGEEPAAKIILDANDMAWMRAWVKPNQYTRLTDTIFIELRGAKELESAAECFQLLADELRRKI